MYVPSQLDVYYFSTQKIIVHFLIALAVILLEQKYYAHQYMQFVTAAAICADETLITLNIFNSNAHAYAAQPTRPRAGCAA